MRTAGWNHGAALFLRNQLGGLKLFNSGRQPAWAVLTTGTARTRRNTSFRIFYWLEVADFALVFLFLFLGLVFHVTFHLFVVCSRSDVISVPSFGSFRSSGFFFKSRPPRRTPYKLSTDCWRRFWAEASSLQPQRSLSGFALPSVSLRSVKAPKAVFHWPVVRLKRAFALLPC